MHHITLTTDFGTRDWFVGTMKGVIARIAPTTRIIDLTHEVTPGEIRAGAFALRASYRFFPKGTVHVVVVDPGVGSARKAIAVQTADCFFVGPDNGVLSWALAREKVKAVHLITNADYFLKPLSRTFHGRDVFAPVAAHLSRGVPIHKFGPKIRDFIKLDWPAPRAQRAKRDRTFKRDSTAVQGEIIYVDRFGNAISNLDAASLPHPAHGPVEVISKGRRVCTLAEFYGAVPIGKPVAVMGSSGLLEIAVNDGSAARKLRLRVGDLLIVRPRPNKL